MTSHPWDFTDEMIDVIAAYPNIMKCIHLPVQSGSTEMLRLMGRRYSREEYLDLVRRIREKIPGCAITTDIIVGFPNETEEQFEETLTLCQEVGYDSAFTFIYSPRKGTPAAKIVDNVTSEDKHARFDRLIKVIEEGVIKHATEMVDKTYKVLVDGPSKKNSDVLSGYTENGKLVHFRGPEYLKGAIVSVKIVESHTFSMIGELVDDPLLALTKNVKEELEKEPAFASYLAAKKAYEENEELSELRKAIVSSQREMALALKNGEESLYEECKKRYLECQERFNTHPLVCNYENYKADLAALLEQVKETLE